MPTTTDDLLEMAKEVRSTIETLLGQRDPVLQDVEEYLQANGAPTKYRFPDNWCDFASCVLAGYIARELNGERAACVVRASKRNVGSPHWWVRCGNVDIDITCDQFENAPGAIVVEGPSTWHAERFEDASSQELSSRTLMKLPFELLVTRLASRVDELTRDARAHRAVAKYFQV